MVPTMVVLVACTGPEPHPPHHAGPSTTTTVLTTSPPPTTVDTGPTADTGTTSTGWSWTTPAECLVPPPEGPFTYASTSGITTEEDFDFDQAGLLDRQRNTDLKGIARDGSDFIVATSIGSDAAGIRSLPSGDILVAQPDTGAVRLVDYASHGTHLVLTGLDFPNGLEVGEDGMAYVSEYADPGRVRMFDPYAPEGQQVIVDIANPNGIALSPDEQTLYIATSEHVFSGDGRIAALDRNADGTWNPTPRLVFEANNSLLDGITTDVCGNLYVSEYSSGHVLRILADGGTVEPIVDLPTSSFGAIRFGAGLGGWSRQDLFLSNRSAVYQVTIGLDGRHVLAPEGTTTTGP